MLEVKSRLKEVRQVLNDRNPGWWDEVRRDLDVLTPGWQSFSVVVWSDLSQDWTEVVILANPVRTKPPATGLFRRVWHWLTVHGRSRASDPALQETLQDHSDPACRNE
jgi:hypothetical protein